MSTVIYGTVDASGHFNDILSGSTVPSGAYSVSAADARAMNDSYGFSFYKPDGSGGVTLDTTLSGAADLAAAQDDQIASLKASCTAYIAAGYTKTVNGKSYTFTLDSYDQRNNHTAAIAVLGVQSQSGTWAASTAFNQYDTILVSGQYYICEVAGTTGTTQPTMPTSFQTLITDGTAQWALFGLMVGTKGGDVWFDAKCIYAIYQEMINYINAARKNYQTLKAQVMAATTVADVQAVAW